MLNLIRKSLSGESSQEEPKPENDPRNSKRSRSAELSPKSEDGNVTSSSNQRKKKFLRSDAAASNFEITLRIRDTSN